MSVFTTFRLADPLGNHLIEIATYTKAEIVLNCTPGAVGVVELTLPTSFDTSLLRRDGRIGIWRSINGAPPYHDNGAIFLIRTMIFSAESTFVRAYHATSLMARRIVAYYAGSAYTDKAGAADDLIKEFWDENAGSSSAVLIRDGPINGNDISAYVTMQADLGQGATVAKEAARRNLLEVAKELAEASASAGTYITFEIIAPTENTLELRTYAGQRGVDRTAGTLNPVVLSEARGNLEQAVLTIDDTDVATEIIAGGVGEGVNRMVLATPELSEIDAYIGWSPFGKIERFLDATNTDTLAALEQEGRAELYTARSVQVLTGRLVETPATMRGVHFDLGDIVTAEHPRSFAQFSARLDMIHETIDGNGRAVEIALRSIA